MCRHFVPLLFAYGLQQAFLWCSSLLSHKIELRNRNALYREANYSARYTIIFLYNFLLYNKKWPRKNENDEVYTRYKNIVKLFVENSIRTVTMETGKMMYLFCAQYADCDFQKDYSIPGLDMYDKLWCHNICLFNISHYFARHWNLKENKIRVCFEVAVDLNISCKILTMFL